MNRGDVWWVNFGASTGSEIQKKRPAIIVSNDAANRNLNRVQVVPLSSNVSKLYPSEAMVRLRGRRSKALADQLTTVARHRLINKAGELTPDEMAGVELAMRVQLGLR